MQTGTSPTKFLLIGLLIELFNELFQQFGKWQFGNLGEATSVTCQAPLPPPAWLCEVPRAGGAAGAFSLPGGPLSGAGGATAPACQHVEMGVKVARLRDESSPPGQIRARHSVLA